MFSYGQYFLRYLTSLESWARYHCYLMWFCHTWGFVINFCRWGSGDTFLMIKKIKTMMISTIVILPIKKQHLSSALSRFVVSLLSFLFPFVFLPSFFSFLSLWIRQLLWHIWATRRYIWQAVGVIELFLVLNRGSLVVGNGWVRVLFSASLGESPTDWFWSLEWINEKWKEQGSYEKCVNYL